MFDTQGRGYLNCEEFKQFVSFVFDIRLHTQVGLDQHKRIILKMGKSELQNIDKDLIIEFVVLRGALELRKAVNDLSFID